MLAVASTRPAATAFISAALGSLFGCSLPAAYIGTWASRKITDARPDDIEAGGGMRFVLSTYVLRRASYLDAAGQQVICDGSPADGTRDMNETLGRFEELILLALLRLGPDAYGLAVRREIERRTARDVSTGALYTALKRLEERGLVASRMGEPTAERGGRRKRHYELLAPGIRALRNSYLDYTGMAEGLGARLRDAAAAIEKGSGS